MPPNSQASGIDRTICNNYIESLAGYCVITYLLGIGDRHQQVGNLAVRKAI